MSYTISMRTKLKGPFGKIPKKFREEITTTIDGLKDNPRPVGSIKLSGQRKGENYWRVTCGKYRIVYEISDGQKTVSVVRIKHRKDAYKESRMTV